MIQAPLLSARLNALTLTLTPPTLNVRMFPAVPDVAVFPSKMKVPGEHELTALLWPLLSRSRWTWLLPSLLPLLSLWTWLLPLLSRWTWLLP